MCSSCFPPVKNIKRSGSGKCSLNTLDIHESDSTSPPSYISLCYLARLPFLGQDVYDSSNISDISMMYDYSFTGYRL